MRIGAMATTILVVDDDDAVRKSIAVALKHKRGFEVLEAENGLVGLELARRQKPNLIISDVIMDNLNGFMMLESLQEDPETAQIPVIMMTTPALNAGAWKSGVAIEYLEKGFSLDELIAIVDKILKIQPTHEKS
jgi:CheY-like chemotaxis protein